MKWLRELLGLCLHKWATIKEVEVFLTEDGKRITANPDHIKMVLRCQNCGDIKTRVI